MLNLLKSQRTCWQIVPTSHGSILHPPRASQVPSNANTPFLYIFRFYAFPIFCLETPDQQPQWTVCQHVYSLTVPVLEGFLLYISKGSGMMPPRGVPPGTASRFPSLDGRFPPAIVVDILSFQVDIMAKVSIIPGIT